ncbi:Uncharacterized protein APZ42_023733 [Daphnia magna]|uniref:Transmembrane protein n=1 Tax=Daphnia magna TaxID=35525 RepID=A0A164UQH8_9CRUS|nr:Uncharacterized protein APZ42_023733 [Daphnia magna]
MILRNLRLEREKDNNNNKKRGRRCSMFLCWVVLALFFSGLAVEIALVVEMLNAFDALIGLDT